MIKDVEHRLRNPQTVYSWSTKIREIGHEDESLSVSFYSMIMLLERERERERERLAASSLSFLLTTLDILFRYG